MEPPDEARDKAGDLPEPDSGVEPRRHSALRRAFDLFRAAPWDWAGAAALCLGAYLAAAAILDPLLAEPARLFKGDFTGSTVWRNLFTGVWPPRLDVLARGFVGDVIMNLCAGCLIRLAMRQIRGEPVRAARVFALGDVWVSVATVSVLVALIDAIAALGGLLTRVPASALLLFALPLAAGGSGGPVRAVTRSVCALASRPLLAAGLYLGLMGLLLLPFIVTPFVALPLAALWPAVICSDILLGGVPARDPRTPAARARYVFATGCLGTVVLLAGLRLVVVWSYATPRESRYETLAPVGAVAISADGRLAAGASSQAPNKSVVVVWDTRTGKRLSSRPVTMNTPVLCFSPAGDWLAVAGFREVQLHSTTGNEIRRLAMPASSIPMVASLAFTSDGRKLAGLLVMRGDLVEWDIASRRARLLGKARIAQPGPKTAVLPDGQTVAIIDVGPGPAYGLDGLVTVFNVPQQKRVASLDCRKARAKAIALSPDGGSLAVCQNGGLTTVVNSRNGDVTARLKQFKPSATSVAVSSGGQRVATGDDSWITVWEPRSAKPRWSLAAAARDSLGPLCLSGDGKTVAVSTIHARHSLLQFFGWTTGTVQLYDARTGRLVRTLR